MQYVDGDGVMRETDDMIDLGIGPIDGWLGGSIRLVAVYADRHGVVYILQESPHGETAQAGRVLSRATPATLRYLAERFELPAAYFRPDPEGEHGQDE